MFRYPEWAWLLMLWPLMALIVVVQTRFKKRRLALFIGTKEDRLVPGAMVWARWVKAACWTLGFFFLVLALMRPHYSQNAKQVSRKGHDVFIVMDTSKSMLARDLQPSRLAYAQAEVKTLLEELKGDRIGLIVFEGEAFVQCPLTLDYSAFSLFLDEVSVGLISRPGTNLSRAMQLAGENFSKKSTAREKIIVVFSDGESFEGDPVSDAQALARDGVVIYTVALGSEAGEPIPIFDSNHSVVGYKKDRQNNVILSKTNVGLLKQVAEAGKGMCLEGNHYGVSDSLARLIAKRDRFKLGSSYNLSYNEKYQPFLCLSFVFFMLGFLIPERKFRFVFRKQTLVCMLLGLCMVKPMYGASFGTAWNVHKGNSAYQKGNYDGAASYYARSKEKGVVVSEALQNEGLVETQKGNYNGAEKSFLGALSGLKGQKKSDAYYNLGNSYLYAKQWDKAIDAYRSCLRGNPKDKDAKRNLEIALRLAKQDKKNQKQNKQKQNQKQQQQEKQNQGSQGDKKGDQNRQNAQQQQKQQQQRQAAEQLRFLDQKEKEARKRYKKQVAKEAAVEKDW